MDSGPVGTCGLVTLQRTQLLKESLVRAPGTEVRCVAGTRDGTMQFSPPGSTELPDIFEWEHVADVHGLLSTWHADDVALITDPVPGNSCPLVNLCINHRTASGSVTTLWFKIVDEQLPQGEVLDMMKNYLAADTCIKRCAHFRPLLRCLPGHDIS